MAVRRTNGTSDALADLVQPVDKTPPPIEPITRKVKVKSARPKLDTAALAAELARDEKAK